MATSRSLGATVDPAARAGPLHSRRSLEIARDPRWPCPTGSTHSPGGRSGLSMNAANGPAMTSRPGPTRARHRLRTGLARARGAEQRAPLVWILGPRLSAGEPCATVAATSAQVRAGEHPIVGRGRFDRARRRTTDSARTDGEADRCRPFCDRPPWRSTSAWRDRSAGNRASSPGCDDRAACIRGRRQDAGLLGRGEHPEPLRADDGQADPATPFSHLPGLRADLPPERQVARGGRVQ